MGKCKTCKHRNSQGICVNNLLQRNTKFKYKTFNSRLITDDGESGRVWVGENFGCIYWEDKEQIKPELPEKEDIKYELPEKEETEYISLEKMNVVSVHELDQKVGTNRSVENIIELLELDYSDEQIQGIICPKPCTRKDLKLFLSNLKKAKKLFNKKGVSEEKPYIFEDVYSDHEMEILDKAFNFMERINRGEKISIQDGSSMDAYAISLICRINERPVNHQIVKNMVGLLDLGYSDKEIKKIVCSDHYSIDFLSFHLHLRIARNKYMIDKTAG